MELAIIILYLAAIFGVGIYCNKFNNSLDDYLLAGRRLGLGLATGTLVATYFGGGYVIQRPAGAGLCHRRNKRACRPR